MDRLALDLAFTIMKRYPDPVDIPYKSWCYVQGYVLAGFEKLWRHTGDRQYLEYIQKFVDRFVGPEGELAGFTGESLDDIMAGTMVVAMYDITCEKKYRAAAQKIFTTFGDYPRNSDGGFWHSRTLPSEMWIDGVFMAQMFMTRYGAVIGETETCFNEAAHQIVTLARRCLKEGTGLYFHAYDESRSVFWSNPASGLSPEVWSEGLGWYALILVETLALMPVGHQRRDEIISILRSLVEGLRTTQDPLTGLWYQVVDKGDVADNWHDTSGSAMFVYAIQRAIDLGLVNREVYGKVAGKGYEGVKSKVRLNEAGLGDIYDACDGVCVQKSYADYIHYPKVVNAKEAVGGVLWAAIIM